MAMATTSYQQNDPGGACWKCGKVLRDFPKQLGESMISMDFLNCGIFNQVLLLLSTCKILTF